MTPRERQILALVAAGLTNQQIAEQLGIAETTIKTHLKRIYQRLGANNAPHAVHIAYQHGHLPCPCGSTT